MQEVLLSEMKKTGFDGSNAEYSWQTIFGLPSGLAAMVSTYADPYAAGEALTMGNVTRACSAMAEEGLLTRVDGEAPSACLSDCSQILKELESTPLYQALTLTLESNPS